MATERDDLGSLAALGEPTRRALYDVVVADGGWVSREQAAAAAGVQRTLAAHHLDRLADAGLLEVDYRRTGRRRGPGAGRPAKLYRRAPRRVEVSIPPRRYELAAEVLADAAEAAARDGTTVDVAVGASADAAGATVAARVRAALGSRPGRKRSRAALIAQLEACGYEPAEGEGATVVLRNCPFHELAVRHTELVCGINRDLLGRVARDVPEARFEAVLSPAEGRCCVVLSPA